MNDERKRPHASGDPNKPAASDLALPHERDEAPEGQRGDPGAAPEGPREVIEQAQRDIRRGLVDTERRGVPSDVPGPHPDPQHTEGAAVPPEGVSRSRPRGRKEGKPSAG